MTSEVKTNQLRSRENMKEKNLDSQIPACYEYCYTHFFSSMF